ncbi:hypothetical protein [Nocardia sp. NPDC005745]|uniref:GHMP family kinase ATP-binding protein n=1 Tax=Nocardia sp. NPDC005745 TaxID=3157061 RepID=UPI0034082A40
MTEDGHKLGLGSSAAVTVATVDALAVFYQPHLDRTDRYRLAMLASLTVGPNGSGGDIAASTWGGWVAYCSPDRNRVRDLARGRSVDRGVTRPLARYLRANDTVARPCRSLGGMDRRQLVTAQIAALESQRHPHRRMTQEEIAGLVDSLGGLVRVIRKADPAEKLELYRQLGLKLTYNHTTRTVVAETSPQPPVGVVVVSGGGYMR